MITTHATTTAPRSTRALADLVRGTLYGVGLAVIACLAVYLIGDLGAPTRVVTGWAPDGADLTIGEVVLTATIAVALGAVALARLRGWTRWTRVVVVVAGLSALPLLGLEVDAASKLTLVSMHLFTGAAAIAGHALARSRA